MPSADTTQRAILLPSDAIGASSTSELQVTKGGVLVTLPFEGSNQNNKRPFTIRVWGRGATSGASNVTVKLYYGGSTTIGSNTNIASSGAVAWGSTVTSNFYLEAFCLVDSTSKILNGLLKGWISATAVAQAFLTNAATAVDPSLEITPSATATAASVTTNQFSLTIQPSASNAANLWTVDGFEFVSQ